ncbi:MAG: helix-turn-helix transcriptional regulator [Streptosporangiaceae bacterium]
MPEFERNVAGIGALAEPVRRGLYLYVCGQPGPVGRDQAATALGITRHQAKFHLDRLQAEGLLVTGYARLTGRAGPGAGRPAKLYRRAPRDIAISLPDRQYELAGQLMADAISETVSTGAPVLGALHRIAAAHGTALGRAATADKRPPRGYEDAVVAVVQALNGSGYEPRSEPGRVTMANCPFHALAQTHTELVCQMNYALIAGLADSIAPRMLAARLAPDEHRCCVVIERRASG